MKFPYWKSVGEQPNDPWIKRPIVEVTLQGPKRTLKIGALLDSGADHSLFRVDVAEALGIDLGTCRKSVVAGIDHVPAECYIAEVAMTVSDLPQVIIPVMFWEKQPIALIGQVGFFDLHRIRFERDHDTFEIIPVKRSG